MVSFYYTLFITVRF